MTQGESAVRGLPNSGLKQTRISCAFAMRRARRMAFPDRGQTSRRRCCVWWPARRWDVTAYPELSDDNATCTFVRELVEHVGDERYRNAASPLVVFFRHGIVHSFMPKQPGPVNGRVEWAIPGESSAGVCVEFLRSSAGSTKLSALRERHLSVAVEGGHSRFVLIPQVLCVDVLAACDVIERDLKAPGDSARQRLGEGFEKWWGRVVDRRARVDAAGRKYLGL